MNLLERRSAKQVNALAITAKRLRIERGELLSRLYQSQRSLATMFNPIGDDLAQYVEKHVGKGSLKPVYERIHENVVILRRSILAWLNAIVRDSTKMSLRHAQDALGPIFEDNQEMVREIGVGVVLAEARLTFKMNTKFANKNDPSVKVTSDTWKGKQNRIVKRVASGSYLQVGGTKVSLSDRIWELSRRSELEMRRLVTSGVAAGEHPSTIARKLKKYVSPQKLEAVAGEGQRGVYYSPFKNAMRIARTEALRAYNAASAEFARNKKWLDGMQVTLSPSHDEVDECDDWAGKIITPDEFEDNFPLHPHCMCYATFVIKPEFLGEAE